MGLDKIDAMVTEIVTEIPADEGISPRDLPLKSHQRLFFERVPLSAELRPRISLENGFDYAGLAEGVEAWGLRLMQARREFMTREQVAEAWFHEEYEPAAAHPRVERRGDRAPARGAGAARRGRGHLRPPPAAGPGLTAVGPEPLAALRIEEEQRRGVDPDLRLLPALDLAGGVEARNDLIGARSGHLGGAGVSGELVQLL